MQDIDFGDPAPKTFPLLISGKRYVIREISAADRVKRDAYLHAHSEYDADGKFLRFTEGFEGLAPYQISLCLFENHGANGEVVLGPAVPEETIKGWSDSFREKLANKVLDMCPSLQLDDEAEIDRQIEQLMKRKMALAEGKAATAKN